MKKIISLLSIVLFASTVFAQQAGSIKGVWFNEEKDGKIEVYEKDGKYYGKLIWMKNSVESDGKTPLKDAKNKDSKLRSRPLLNAVILENFTYKDGKWTSGKVYDPKSGKTYSSEMKMNGEKLEVRGYVGSPAFGRTSVFTRN
ncbi:DUF2147 domain-containing protein [Olivibacter sp. SDN3]|uniref:DUF2147 domain-containing protein n=1 Tax=Olivibacter sp. SDN3 TaxID=2764720 RepID=UPI0016518E86|nr:DUF2147 domain-containing protein [Olivibacter sp. SDN3]QNL49847.1 DUF2147 domain-containing protein [Olivibacter sp. SDN3]